MRSYSRREMLELTLAGSAGISAVAARAADPATSSMDIHQQILELAARQEAERRARFAAVTSKADLDALQSSLRTSFLGLLGGFAQRRDVPPVQKTGTIDADDYVVDKLVFESFTGYFVSALLYKPKKIGSPAPAVLSPCGHSTTGKAEAAYQILHINLAKQGYVVLTYDPVGQGERSQFWDAQRSRSRFNLSCGEHAVLGNPLYLLGTNLARYRIWDGMRALDYLTARPDVDASKIGCVGNSGGGTLTAYISALDPRISAVAIGCYITTLRRRMGNRIEEDPSSDPEQDIFGFVSDGIDHAGLLAMMVPRPTLLATARFDFFPIEGARESFAEARRLYQVAGAGDRMDRAEAAEKHGLSAPLRLAVYEWFRRWLAPNTVTAPVAEVSVKPRSANELLVCAEGQVNLTFHSRPLLPLALEQFQSEKAPERASLSTLLRLDLDRAHPAINVIAASGRPGQTTVVCINGNETRDWREEPRFMDGLVGRGFAVVVVDPRGVGLRRLKLTARGHRYADPLGGVDENIAYNAFLVGRSLMGMRVADVLVAVQKIRQMNQPGRVVLCARRDAALTACFAAGVEPTVNLVATEEMILSFRILFGPEGLAIGAACILPGLLQRFGDIPQVLAEIAPRRILIAAGVGQELRNHRFAQAVPARFSQDFRVLADWVGDR
jgi:Acetyl xylan esterase (AXE1)